MNATEELYGAGSDLKDYSRTQASRSELFKAGVPLQWRDTCSHLLLPLNECRYKNPFTFSCDHERHAYEKCLYKDHKYRVKVLEKRKAQQQLQNKQQSINDKQ